MSDTLFFCTLTELKRKQSIGKRVRNLSIFATWTDGQVNAYINRCPHLGTSLEFMPDQFLNIDKTLIQCTTHGALFLPDTGECVSGPCAGEFLEPIELVLENDSLMIGFAGETQDLT